MGNVHLFMGYLEERHVESLTLSEQEVKQSGADEVWKGQKRAMDHYEEACELLPHNLVPAINAASLAFRT